MADEMDIRNKTELILRTTGIGIILGLHMKRALFPAISPYPRVVHAFVCFGV